MRNLKEENIYLDMKPVGTTPTAEKILFKAVDVGKAVINTPINVVQNTASTVLDTTLRGGAEQVGIVKEEKEKPVAQASENPKNLIVV
jgi:hypothetical protein